MIKNIINEIIWRPDWFTQAVFGLGCLDTEFFITIITALIACSLIMVGYKYGLQRIPKELG